MSYNTEPRWFKKKKSHKFEAFDDNLVESFRTQM